MKRIIYSLVAMGLLASGLLVASPSFAANNITQKGDGTTVWTTSRRGASSQEVPVGPGMVSMLLTQISNMVTGYIVMPFDGKIIKVYSVLQGAAQTGAAALGEVYVGSGSSANTFTLVTNGVAPLTIAQNSTAGTVDSWTPSSGLGTFDAGGVIAIQFDGGGTNAGTSARISIVVAPQ